MANPQPSRQIQSWRLVANTDLNLVAVQNGRLQQPHKVDADDL